ncbi:MAG: molecular chaperone HtpG [Hyphomicrobiales bacterium]|nr:MAG: molecular chaperone HtpG [Hyphomicrobiales bacterium]
MSPSTDTTSRPQEAHKFEAEVSRLLHLMVHSVYSNKDIFLRELISNAADACEKLRQLSLVDPALVAGESEFGITVSANVEEKTLTVADNGIGMSHEELIANLGTIARSGTGAFLEGLEKSEDRTAFIGQFGVGFYASFMVAAEVEVISRRAGSSDAWSWRSDGKGTFTVEAVEGDAAPARGTRVILHLLDDALDYAEDATIERIVRDYSAHVPVPITLMRKDAEEPEQIADGSALWRKSRSSVTEEEYKEFYGHVGGLYDEPALTLHYKAEGRQEYSVLLFVPSTKPFDLFDPSRKGRVRLYVRRVFISDEVELLPPWLRFVRGVIDSDDLPLNLSRELLQDNPILDSIRKGVTNRVLSELEKLAEKDAEAYAKVWEAFGAVLKEGLYEDPARRDALFKLARFQTTKGDGWRTLAEIVTDMRENQTALFYAVGEDRAALEKSPHLEGFRARDIEVLLLTDPVDAFWVRTALGFDGKPFHSITQGSADLDAIPVSEDAPAGEAGDEAAIAGLVAALKTALGETAGDVRVSERLAASPVCLVAADFGPDRQLERLLAQQEGGAKQAPVLEINPRHGLIKVLADKLAAGGDLGATPSMLFGLARILDGDAPDDPSAFAEEMAKLIEAACAG